jgi:hypothetical protein
LPLAFSNLPRARGQPGRPEAKGKTSYLSGADPTPMNNVGVDQAGRDDTGKT